MNDTNIFQYAVMNKLRYTYKGVLTTEDLFDMNLKSLDEVYKVLMRERKDAEEESLLSTTKKNHDLDVKIEIVKWIVNYKQDAYRKQREAVERKEKRQRIAEILAKREDDAMCNMSDDELRKMLESLS